MPIGPDSFPWIALCFLGGLLLTGLFLIRTGRRGKRLDDHPVCRKCAFDLVGSAGIGGSAGDEILACPECGFRGLPRIGNRRRSPGRVAVGTGLLVVMVLAGGALAYTRLDATTVMHLKPLPLVRWEARAGGPDVAERALTELIRRYHCGRLAGPYIDAVLDDAVTHGPPGNPAAAAAAWGGKWDELAAELFKAGHGSPAQREAVARSWLITSVEVRPAVRMGEGVPARVRDNAAGPPHRFGFYEELGKPVVRFGEHEYRMGISSGGGLSGSRGGGGGGSGWTGSTIRSGYGLPKGLGVGKHEFVMEVTRRVFDGHGGTLIAEWTETHPASFEYVPPDGDPVMMRRDDEAGRRLEAAVEWRDHQIEAASYGSHASLDIGLVTAPIAYRLVLRRGEQRWEYTTISTSSTGGSHGFGLGGELPDALEDGAVVDVVFEPDADVARGTTDLTEILDHRFVVEGVRIVRP
ncbi:MAG: hypothetical protein AAFX76_12970 [Planctomycetota bacterium]